MDRAIVVSLHDVAPSTLGGVRWLLAALDALAVRPRVLKVVPNESGQGSIDACPELVALLQQEAAAGSEIVLHGYTHRAEGPARGPWAARLRAAVFAGDAAEFLSLDGRCMAERLDAGRAALGHAGLEPLGFCAPAWLSAPELPPLLRDRGFRYLVGMATLHDLRRGRRLVMPWYGYMGAGEVQERLIGLGGRLGLAASSRVPAPAIKVFLHPQRAARSRACADTLRILARLTRERRPVTYGQLLDSYA